MGRRGAGRAHGRALEQARAVKLQEYWDFFDFLKSVYPASWALGCRDLPGVGAAYLFVQWDGGTVTDCRIIGPDDPPPTSPAPFKATYVLGMDYRDWKALHDGYDAQRTVMYRKILLEQGDLLEFFKAIYFFVESLSVIGTVPAAYPDWVDGTLVRLEPARRHIDPFRGLRVRSRLRACPGYGARPSSGPKERSTCSASSSGSHGLVPMIRTTGSGLLYSDTS